MEAAAGACGTRSERLQLTRIRMHFAGIRNGLGSPALVYRAGSLNPWVEFDFTKRALIVRHVLVKDRSQCLRLLWAQIDSLKITNFHLVLRLLLHRAKHQKEVPDVHPHLHAVGVGLAIVGS